MIRMGSSIFGSSDDRTLQKAAQANTTDTCPVKIPQLKTKPFFNPCCAAFDMAAMLFGPGVKAVESI